VNEIVILKGRNHEERIVDATRDVALKNRIANVFAPHRQPLALTFFKVATSDDCPTCVTREHAPTRLDLIVNVNEPGKKTYPTSGALLPLESVVVLIKSISFDVPPARENQASPRACKVENGLRCSGGVLLASPRNQNRKHSIAISNRLFDNLAIARGAGENADSILKRLQFANAGFTTDTTNLVTSVQAMLHHIPPEFA
jgi:hypothetical protein